MLENTRKAGVMTMSTRYLTNMTMALGAGFLVVASRIFAAGPVAWLAFAIAIGIAVIAAAAQLDSARGLFQRTFDLVVVVLSAATIVTSLVFSGAAVRWLSFAEALGFVALAVTGLTVHEIGRWRAERGMRSLRGASGTAPAAYLPGPQSTTRDQRVAV